MDTTLFTKIKCYSLRQTLGVGSFGKVKLAVHQPTKSEVAVKVLNRSKVRQLNMTEKLSREIQILRFLRHPHIIYLYEVIDTNTDVFLVMEYVSGGELFDYIVEKGQLRESEARRFFQQLVSGIECCHLNHIVHRDLKPENLLLDQHNNIKIADFGLANTLRDGYLLGTSCGSPNYAAPEVIAGRLYAGPEVDIWSCGVILYALAYGSLPFDEESIPLLFKRIKSGKYSLRATISHGARSMIARLLVVNPMKRATMAEIREHEWFQADLPEYLSEPWTENAASGLHSVNSFEHIPIAASEQMDSVTRAILDQQELSKRVLNDKLAPRRKCVTVSPASTKKLVFSSREPITQIYPAIQQPGIKVRKRKWYLGIQSKKQPAQVMLQIYGVLGNLRFDWKTVNPYKLRCRWKNAFGTYDIKIALQLFQVQANIYLLDFQNICGHPYMFMTLSSKIICNLHRRLAASSPRRQTQTNSRSAPGGTLHHKTWQSYAQTT